MFQKLSVQDFYRYLGQQYVTREAFSLVNFFLVRTFHNINFSKTRIPVALIRMVVL